MIFFYVSQPKAVSQPVSFCSTLKLLNRVASSKIAKSESVFSCLCVEF